MFQTTMYKTHLYLFIVIVFFFSINVFVSCNEKKKEEQPVIQAQTVLPPAPKYEPRSFPSHRRIILLGFDGIDPEWVKALLPHLPNINTLVQSGLFTDLATSTPPSSPVAWSSFWTGSWSKDHLIFDFLLRNPRNYMIQPSVVDTLWKPRFFPPYAFKNLRVGKPFYEYLDVCKVGFSVLSAPFIFPSDTPLKYGNVLMGIGVPDILGTNSTFAVITDDASLLKKTFSGGISVKANNSGRENEFDSFIPGPKQLSVENDNGSQGGHQIHIQLLQKEKQAKIKSEDISLTLSLNKPSEKVIITYLNQDKKTIKGQTYFILKKMKPLVLYVAPVGIDPQQPLWNITIPSHFLNDLHKENADMRTIGWPSDTSALGEGIISSEDFMNEALNEMDIQERMTIQAIRDKKKAFISAFFTATDRVSHMFLKDGPFHDGTGNMTETKKGASKKKKNTSSDTVIGDPPIVAVYKKMDAVIGNILKALTDETMIIMSDHGFHSFTKGFSINTWLFKKGYIKLHNNNPQYGDNNILLKDVNWEKTQAYSYGTGQIYINLKGREKYGTVEPKEYLQLIQEIQKRLLALRDPEGNKRVIRNVVINLQDRWAISETEIPSNLEGTEYFSRVPDLQIEFEEGYRASWISVLGGFDKDYIVSNTKKWSGDHASSITQDTAGFFIINKKVSQFTQIEIIDLAPSILNFYDCREQLTELKPEGKTLEFD